MMEKLVKYPWKEEQKSGGGSQRHNKQRKKETVIAIFVQKKEKENGQIKARWKNKLKRTVKGKSGEFIL